MLFKSMVFMAIYLVNFQINIIKENRDTFDDCKYIVKELDKLGKDSVKISSGDFKNFKGKSYFKNYANELTSSAKFPILLVGGNRTVDSITETLNTPNIEHFSVCRPLICEPDFINKFEVESNYGIHETLFFKVHLKR